MCLFHRLWITVEGLSFHSSNKEGASCKSPFLFYKCKLQYNFKACFAQKYFKIIDRKSATDKYIVITSKKLEKNIHKMDKIM